MAKNSSSPIGVKTVLVGAILGWFVFYNRFLFGLPCPLPESDFKVLTNHKELDFWLEQYKDDLGDDYEPYRHHCLRVLSYAKYSLSNELFEDSAKVLGIAVAHHDIALWTDGAMNYLEPSSAVMQRANHDLNESELKLAHEIIMQHHKYTHWSSGSVSAQENELLVNAVRKADWTDFTYGMIRYGSPLGNVCEAYRIVPDLGFHMVLLGMGARLHPKEYLKRLDVLKILKW